MPVLFLDDDGRDVESATWFSPHGPLLVCAWNENGYDLFSLEDWEKHHRASYRADEAGRVFFHDHFTGWTVPDRIREKAIL
jgi:hypothetical protein